MNADLEDPDDIGQVLSPWADKKGTGFTREIIYGWNKYIFFGQ